MFFFPSGWSVDQHVRHFFAPGGAVRQSTCGMVEEVPVPRRMTSTEPSLGAGEKASMEPMAEECAAGEMVAEEEDGRAMGGGCGSAAALMSGQDGRAFKCAAEEA